jgi:UDP-N-acetylglucosamine--N-acetylmuramyl-(pentapeptide) pyrophosphoryl-undecaprenol N-acetylglucosamine transferase
MRLILTGGGTGGHIIPNIAITAKLKEQANSEIDVLYIGSNKGIDREMVEKAGIPFKGVHCGKLRRYFSWENLLDLFKIPIGICQSLSLISRFSPNLVFSKGGYVSIPVVIAAKLLGKKIIVHESDVVPGLANKICFRMADKILLSFPESAKYLDKFKEKLFVVGNPVRKEIMHGSKTQGYQLTKFNRELPIVLVMGGSQGAQKINQYIWSNLRELIPICQIIHICGSGKKGLALSGLGLKNYFQYEFVKEELAHFYAVCDLIITRAGANSIAEIMSLKKPAILIPLPKSSSRGDQIINAKIIQKKGLGLVLDQDKTDSREFLMKLKEFMNAANLETIGQRYQEIEQCDSLQEIVKIIYEFKPN